MSDNPGIDTFDHGVTMLFYQNRNGQEIYSVLLKSSKEMVTLDPLNMSPLKMYTLDLEHLKWIPFEETPL